MAQASYNDTESFKNVLTKLSEDTGFSKSTLIRAAVRDMSKKDLSAVFSSVRAEHIEELAAKHLE